MSYNGTSASDDADDLKDLPPIVVETLGLRDSDPSGSDSDDSNLLTFRYFLLSVLFVIPGAFIDTMNSYRTTSAPYSILFVQFLSYPAGKWLAKVLPNKRVSFFGLFSFDLNPGPWSIKESVLVTLTAASGATGNQGTAGISLAQIYYGEEINPLVALIFMYCIVWTGYSFAAIARNFVLYDPQFVWPQALMQTSLFKALSTFENNAADRKQSSKQMRVFGFGLLFMFLWQFLPEFIFPMTSSLAVLCWLAPKSHTVNFLGSGLGGLGLLNVSLDWSNITSTVMLSPYWTIFLQFVGFVLMCWTALPFAKWYDNGRFAFGLMDNRILLNNGTVYPTKELITADLRFNETAYALYGPINLGNQRVLNIFFDYAAYVCAIVWILSFGYEDLITGLQQRRQRNKRNAVGENQPLLAHKYTDRINKIYSLHEDVPNSWFIMLFALSFVLLSSVLLLTDQLFIPWKTYIVALILGALIVTPMSYLYAISNFQLAIGTVNELLYGLMIQTPLFSGPGNKKHPCGASIYGAIAGNCWYRAQYLLQDQKIGMYNNIPPKMVFFSQIFGDLIGVPFNYLSLRWVISNKFEYLRGTKIDPLHQWTGQLLTSYNSNSIGYVLVGPKRLFQYYKLLPYGFAVGAILPLILFGLYRRFGWSTIRQFNLTIIFSTMSHFYGNISTGYLTQFLIGTFTMHYLYKYKRQLFQTYNYVLAASFDTGFNLCNLFIFIFFGTGLLSGWKPVAFPNWWGNDAQSIEKCYAL